MEREFIRFVERPDGETYLAARDAMLSSQPATLSADDLHDLARLLEQAAYEELLGHVEALPPSAALSARVHYFAAEAAAAIDDSERAELERFLFVVCLRGILATGDGSSEQPYIICHASDEADVLEALEKQVTRQTLFQEDARVYEVVDCQDESQVVFDVTAVTGMPLRRQRARVRRVARSRPREAISRTPR